MADQGQRDPAGGVGHPRSPRPTAPIPRRLIGDDRINSKPSWSLDDKTIFFHRLDNDTAKGFQIWAVSPDGADLRQITTDQPGANEYPGT